MSLKPSATPTPKDEIKFAIQTWEGLWQAQPQDAGNYVEGRLIGTMRGVTPAVLAAHRGVPATSVTEAMMKSISLDEAAEIGLMRFYRGTGLDLLPWGPATSALVDVGWGSGPRQAVLFAQRLSGAVADGYVGPETIRLYSNWVAQVGWEAATIAVNKMRREFYDLIIRRNPVWEMYRKGWMNRANWMMPGTAWWLSWQRAMPPLPAQQVPAGVLRDAPMVEAKPASQVPQTRAATAAGVSLTGAGVIEALGATSAQVQAASGAMGVVKWVLIGVALIGLAFAVWKMVEERKVPV